MIPDCDPDRRAADCFALGSGRVPPERRSFSRCGVFK